jgi:hypothetical protein
MSVRDLLNRSRSNGQVVNVLNGNALRRMLRGKAPGERARIAAQLLQYHVEFVDLSAAQIARLVNVNPGAVSVALGHAGVRGPHTRTIDRLIRRYGADALLRGLDRATAPQIAAE